MWTAVLLQNFKKKLRQRPRTALCIAQSTLDCQLQILCTAPASATGREFIQLDGAGVTPGMLKDQKGAPLAIMENPHLTHAVMDLFLGRHPIDIAGKLSIGEGLLYAANGFK